VSDLIDWDGFLTRRHRIDHLSASSIAQYLRCPRQWAYVRLFGIKAPPDGGLVRGTAFHAGAEHGMRQKIATGNDPNPAEVADVARDAAVEGLEQAERDAEETGLVEHIRDQGMDRGQVIDGSARLAETWAIDAAPHVAPVAVEQEISAEIAGVTVSGRLDVVEADGVRDWKTSGKTPAADDVAKSVQTEIYAAITQLPISYTYLISGKDKIKVVTYDVPNSMVTAAPALAADTVAHVAAGIAAGSFPRNRAGWHCSRRWCAFHSRCMSGRDDATFAEIRKAGVSIA
jgi:RecB family exonuclease